MRSFQTRHVVPPEPVLVLALVALTLLISMDIESSVACSIGA